MTNEEALETLIDNAENGYVDIEEVKLVFAEMQSNSDEDCISRQAVLDLVEDMTDQFGVEHRVITEGVISMLPPVTPKPKTECSCEQIKWERDIAIEQLHELGYELGQKIGPCKDCISRKAVIDINHNHYGEMPNHINHQIWEEINALPSIQPTTKENLVVGDCISRQAVLDMVEDMTDQFGANHRVVTEGMISMLPPVNPQEPKADVLDKIRAEIKEESRFCPFTEGLERALEIIDKYTAESEDKE